MMIDNGGQDLRAYIGDPFTNSRPFHQSSPFFAERFATARSHLCQESMGSLKGSRLYNYKSGTELSLETTSMAMKIGKPSIRL